jgi:hypothetical protein
MMSVIPASQMSARGFAGRAALKLLREGLPVARSNQRLDA